MVTVNPEECTGCGICVQICHEHCMSLTDGKIDIYYPYCSTCTQCIAVCPTRALRWNGVEPVPFENALLPSFEAIQELFKQRRTVRHFTPVPVERELLEKVAACAADAPTHSHGFRIVIVDEPALIDAMDRALMRFTARLHAFIYRPRVLGKLVKLVAPSLEGEYLRARPKLESALASGTAFRSRPAAFVMVVAEKRTPLGRESAQYAIYNMTLLAQAAGLGCRNLVGNQSVLGRDPALRRALRLRQTERIFGLIGLGYPAVRYRNKVEGRALPLQWNGDG